MNKQVGMWNDDELVMVSAIEHYSYCPRQCALIHVEQTFDENIYTLRGRAAHVRVDEPDSVISDGMRIERALPLWSEKLGLVGKADLVEFHELTPYPVDYKHGPRMEKAHDDLQLCAIAICLEEMTGQTVPKGAIYHVASRRRREVVFTADMRSLVEVITAQIRDLIKLGVVPQAEYSQKCRNCSLIDSCLPEVADPVVNKTKSLLQKLFDPVEGF